MILNGADVTDEIRTPEMSQAASLISAQKVVREFLLDVQRALARKNNVIMDGRDIGTVVLPQADVKIFLTADVAVRARRRWLELQEKGGKQTMAQVQKDLAQGDLQDSTRAIAPLKSRPRTLSSSIPARLICLPASRRCSASWKRKSGRCRNASKSRQDGGLLLRRPPGSGDGRPGGGSGLRRSDAGADYPQPPCGRGIRGPGACARSRRLAMRRRAARSSSAPTVWAGRFYDELAARHSRVLDATCPFVKRIHTIVSPGRAGGAAVHHHRHEDPSGGPGYCRLCDEPLIFESAAELENWLFADPQRRNLPLVMVCQTTSTKFLWNSCAKIVKKSVQTAKYLIQYVKLLKIGRMRRHPWPARARR